MSIWSVGHASVSSASPVLLRGEGATAHDQASLRSEVSSLLPPHSTLTYRRGVPGAQIFFVDEAHFRADADLHGKWVLTGQPALVDSSCPRWGEQASYYSAVCLETGEVEHMELSGTSTSATSAACLKQLRERHTGPLIVIWDNGPAHGGEAVRTYLETPDLGVRLCRLPAYSPDCNADEAIWAWVREEVTANTCLGTTAAVQEKVGRFFDGLTARTEEVTSRCRTKLQALAAAVIADDAAQALLPTDQVVLTCASV